MRGLFNGVVRGLVVVTVVGALAMPAHAAPREERSVVRFIRGLIVRVFGDGLTDPKPKTEPKTVTSTGDLLSDPKP